MSSFVQEDDACRFGIFEKLSCFTVISEFFPDEVDSLRWLYVSEIILEHRYVQSEIMVPSDD